jgi:serine/threonine-protein kinase HipA
VERFDVRAGSPERLHLVSLAGLLESIELRYVHLLEATRRLTADRRELIEAVRRMLFNVRAANADDHGKNHAFLLDPATGDWRLSPAYDLTLNYSSDNRYHGLFATSFGAAPRLSSLVELALEFGITQHEFDEVDVQVVQAIQRWPACAKEYDLPPRAGIAGAPTA